MKGCDDPCRYRPSDSWEQVGLPHAEAMVGGARPKLKRGRPKEVKRGSVKEKSNELWEEEEGRKLDLCEGDSLDCRVLLTRLETSGDKDKESCLETPIEPKVEGSNSLVRGRTKPCKSRQKTCKAYRLALEPNNQSKVLCTLPVVEPRKRRLASLNAEAVNSLLLYREHPQGSRLANKLQSNGNLAKNAIILGHNTPSGPKVAKSDICGTGSSKKHQKAMKMEDVGLLSLYGPIPRRQASLNAAALLKITSTSFKAKHRGAKTNYNQLSGVVRIKLKKRHHHELHHRQSQAHPQLVQRCCDLCKREYFHPEPQWEGTTGGNGFIRSDFQCGSLLGYLMKSVEEPVETQVTPSFCCCSQERSGEYCHRLALFLGQKSFGDDELEDHSLSKDYLLSPHSLAHPHALTIGPHPYPCFSGYYVHFAHHETSSTLMTSMSSSPMPYPSSSVASITLCPGGVQSPKLLSPTGSHPSGIAHPVYCYGEPCRISRYPYRAVTTLASRGCCYNAGCSSCSHNIKMEDYSSPLEDHSPPSVPVSPAPGCLATAGAPPASQSVPCLQNPLSDPSQPRIPLHVTRECPQSAKPPSSSRSGVRGGSHIQDKHQLGPAASGAAKQQRITRRRATNGWLPVGVPFEKEVFAVGEETTVLRKCFEGVQRDGEVIRVRDTVLLRSGTRKKSLPYVAKISALWKDPESGEMMMSLFWFYRPEHTQGGRDPNTHCENEIFASRHQDENSVACIEDKCYVLTLAQYCRYCAMVTRQGEDLPESATKVVPPSVEYAVPAHCCVPTDIDPDLVFMCRHVYDFRYGRILKSLQ
ncbi:bromo adjacent homology domain-containing 1 protein isoform X1 [Salmo salar]|uniref:Bromo adjacent homology domain-containing 1 protein-like isoform X1 n=1 Tax=Salmo salar TaxID=8030 RepID=A0A1S3SBQ8_SALSA|nr:bromo adjacent homology domain-containing 1 protein isoform X1 [Salmo salar]XP_014061828.1 bromo adjacent homology domain-containing 1 protein isoform X1 [Salmo salar]|eukprot:XP_014061762.1 PREDICTED: bromo adjacent homology domain-containing 1 protein-like isoform X1 [Salmo salar]